ncbi:MAG: WavE lipopolysaccharide synthesis family protein [Alphaproteobacteria bacterium]|nr:WavE lipopolysaccharide synthesis family protein [Alphaproteobacteria bacterium]
MCKTKDISFVIQGKVNPEVTSQAMAGIRALFPDAEIVLSTYTGTDTTGLDCDKVVLVEDPGCFFYNGRENNINRQIQTTLEGLKAATRTYAFKLRTDFIITGRGFLDYFDLFPKSDENYKVFEHKILSCVFFARDPRKRKPRSFHPSDLAFFGLRADLLKLFDIPFMTEEESVSYKKGRYKYVPEQHIWVNCLLKSGKEIHFKHQRDTSEKIATDTEKYAVSNFIYLDFEQFSLVTPKHLSAVTSNHFRDVITHIEWQRLYRKYLDVSLVVPERDPMRDFLEKKTFGFRRADFIAKLCAIFFVGKPLRNFRREIRKKIYQRLTRDICLQ